MSQYFLVRRYFAPAKSNRAMKVGTGSTWNEGPGYSVALCLDPLPLPPNITQDSWNWIFLKWRSWVLGRSFVCFDPLPPNITQDRTECRLYLEWFLLFNICFAFSFCHLIFFPSLLDWYWQIYYNTNSQAGASSSHFCYDRTLNLNPLVLAHYDRWCKVISWSATTFQ